MEGTDALFGNFRGYASHNHINDCLSNEIVLLCSLYDLLCIKLMFGRQIIALTPVRTFGAQKDAWMSQHQQHNT